MSERQKFDHDLASLSLGPFGEQMFEGALVGRAREELIAVDQIEESHRLSPERMHDVPSYSHIAAKIRHDKPDLRTFAPAGGEAVVDDMAMPTFSVRPPARPGHEMAAAEEELEPIVEQVHAQAMADQARRYGVEDLLQGEAARRSDHNDGLFVVGGAPFRQGLQRCLVQGDFFFVTGVAAANQLVDEAALSVNAVEVAAAAQ